MHIGSAKIVEKAKFLNAMEPSCGTSSVCQNVEASGTLMVGMAMHTQAVRPHFQTAVRWRERLAQ